MLHPIPAAPGHTPKLPCPYTRTRRALSGATRSPRRSVEQRPAQSELKKVRKCLFRSVVRQHRKAVACATHAPWLVWCTRSLPKRSLCRIPSWATLGIGGSPDEARCREGTYKTPVTTTLSRSFYCSALLSLRAAGLLILFIFHSHLHIAAPSPARFEKTSHVLHQVLRNSVKRRRGRRTPHPRAPSHITEMKRVSHRAVHILALCLMAWVVFASGTAPLPHQAF